MDAWLDDFLALEGADASTRNALAAFFGAREDAAEGEAAR